MNTSNYLRAKNELQYISETYSGLITFDDFRETITFSFNDPKKRSVHFDSERLKIRIFLVAFFFIMMLIAGRDMLSDTNFLIYAAVVALAISLLTSISFKSNVVYDFKNQYIKKRNRKVKFSDCKSVRIEEVTAALALIQYNVIIETLQGKMNLHVMQFGYNNEGEQNARHFHIWLSGHIIQ